MTFTDPPAAKAGIVRALYDWMMRNAKGRYAWATLGGLTFAEALWSVLGGAAGYAIGVFLFDSLGQWLISIYGMGDDLVQFQQWYATYGAWVIIGKGFSPLPYKLVTIASGFAQYSFAMFMVLSVLTRGGRYFLVAGLLYWKGDVARRFIEKRLEATLFVFLLVIVSGFVAVKYLF